MADDLWKGRSVGMICGSCMFYVEKKPEDGVIHKALGRCRKNAPTIDGWPVVFHGDWCGEHKLDENKFPCRSEFDVPKCTGPTPVNLNVR